MVFLNGDAIAEPDKRGERIVDDSFLLLFNASPHDLDFSLPGLEYGEHWHVVVDTGDTAHLPPRTHSYTSGSAESSRLSSGRDAERLPRLDPGEQRTVRARSVVVLRSDKRLHA
jgi:glycogen operon protein